LRGHSFSAKSFCEIWFDGDTGLAIRDAFEVFFNVIVGCGSIGVIAMLIWIKLDGLGVGLYSLVIFFCSEGGITLFLPVLGRLLDVHSQEFKTLFKG
jgi:hypothetical protein